MGIYWVIIISLLFSAFFSGMEIAFVSSNRLRFELNKKSNHFTGKIVAFLNNHSEQFISTMLVGNNIALVIYGIRMAQVLDPLIAKIIPNEAFITIIQTLLATLLVLITGEFIPKTIFKNNPNLWITIFSPFLLFIYIILYPITIFTNFLAACILKLFKVYQPNVQKQSIGKIDLDYLINESIEHNEEGANGIENDVRIFQNALDFTSIKLRDCIVPRTEIIALPSEGTSLQSLINTFVETGLSKILIYIEGIDNIVGYIHSSDLFKIKDDWHPFLRKMPIVPETMAANHLMKIFTKEKKSIAVVVDELGGTAGIVTLEDIIEEIFGEIEDEHDNNVYTAKKLGDNEYLISGRLEISALNDLFDIGIPESENYVTVAGFILYHYQKLPKINETIHINQWTFKVIQTHINRIELVKLTL